MSSKSDLNLKRNSHRRKSEAVIIVIYLVIHVEPLRMMINFVSLQGDPGHEAKSLVKILEDELLVDGVSVLHHGPALKVGALVLFHTLSINVYQTIAK